MNIDVAETLNIRPNCENVAVKSWNVFLLYAGFILIFFNRFSF